MAKTKQHRFGEVCRLLDVQPYVLRYWETEFPALANESESSGQRTYSEDDLQVIRRIKELLYSEGFTLVGAKKKLQAELSEGAVEVGDEIEETRTAPEEAIEEPAAEAVEEEAVEKEAVEEEAPIPAGEATDEKNSSDEDAADEGTEQEIEENVEEPEVEQSSSDTATPTVDIAELEAILGEAQDLLKAIRSK